MPSQQFISQSNSITKADQVYVTFGYLRCQRFDEYLIHQDQPSEKIVISSFSSIIFDGLMRTLNGR